MVCPTPDRVDLAQLKFHDLRNSVLQLANARLRALGPPRRRRLHPSGAAARKV
jgi:hypothetical protein